MSRSWVTVLLGLGMAGVSLAYPWIVLGLYGNSLFLIGLWLAVLALWLARAREQSARLRVMMFLLALLAAVLALVEQVPGQLLAKMYPVIISSALFLIFSGSLLRPPSIIERMVRRSGRVVSPEASRYMRWVTIVWIIFFVCNATVAIWLALFAGVSEWAFYNGFLSYVIIGAIMGVEFLVRIQYQRREAAGQVNKR